jgi:GntR family transcriptional regulator, transcriptional repressor for pyruvate dehydrogenase complex
MSSSGQAAMSFARKPIKPILKADHLSTEMAQQIVDGQLLAGTVLASEKQLGSSYGMSRPHVRQALQRLAAAGLIATRHGLGSYVNTKERWNLFDPLLLEAFVQSGNLAAIATELVELRKMVEVECCRLAGQRITASEVQELKKWLERMDETLDDAEAIAEADILFHAVIIRASRNRFLQGIMTYLHEPLSKARVLTMQAGQREGRMRAQQHHKAIFAALAERNSLLAQEGMQLHMKQLEEDMENAFRIMSLGASK